MNRQDALHALSLPISARNSEIQQRLNRKEKSLRSGLKNALNSEMKETYQRRLRRLGEIRTCLAQGESSIKSHGRADSDVDALARMLNMAHNPGQSTDTPKSDENHDLGEDPVDVDDSWLVPDVDTPAAEVLTAALALEDEMEAEEEERTKTTEASTETYDAFYDLDLDDLDPDITPVIDLVPDPVSEDISARLQTIPVTAPTIETSVLKDASVVVENTITPSKSMSKVQESTVETAIEVVSDDEETIKDAVVTAPHSRDSESDTSAEETEAATQVIPGGKDPESPDSRFEILEKVASSSTYQHFKAKDRLRGETVLLKTLAANLAQDRTSQKTFLETSLAISRMSHPNLIKVFDLHEFAGQLYVSMEWLEPYSLRDEIETRKRNGHCFESYELMRIARELRDLLSTLQILVPHCGMKPENIHYQESGALKLIDIDPFDHRSSYAAQELQQTDGEASAADQFSMAVLLSELASEKIGYHERAGKDMPGGFFIAVQRAQSKDPELRFPDLDSFVTALASRGEVKPSWRRPVLQMALMLFVFTLGILSASQQSKIQKFYERIASKRVETDSNDNKLREVNTLVSNEIPRVINDSQVTQTPKIDQCSVCKASASCVTCRGQGKLMDSCKHCNGQSKISRDCQECDLAGKKSCSSCSGSGTLTPKCIQCDGAKTLECEECLGKKIIKQLCADCKGKKSGPCQVCKSNGTIKELCKDCLGKKEIACVECKGQIHYTIPCDYVLNYMGQTSPCVKGVVRCPECSGKGKVKGSNCDLCDGSGRQECVKFCLKGRIKKICVSCNKTGRQPCANKRCRLRGSWQIDCPNC
ncbi:MAG: hypothetical protein P1V97_37285, partial [Planctomycetota bacterium]|nr:hypothetical protein [Planctomycetota bacterium]